MTTDIAIPSTTNNASSTIPWKFLGSVTSVKTLDLAQDVVTTEKPQDIYNGTGYFIEGEEDSLFGDLKTVALACFGTLMPLIVIVGMLLAFRSAYNRYRLGDKPSNSDSYLVKDDYSVSDSTSKPLHSHLLNDQGTAETQLDITEWRSGVDIFEDLGSATVNNRATNANGSVITMTLKNNHLIVETEERNDIDQDSKETKVRYSPSTQDGVFVVEVQQGVRRSPGSGGPTSLVEQASANPASNQCALIHNPPGQRCVDEQMKNHHNNESAETAPTNNYVSNLPTNAKTGLASSVTSLNSTQLHSYSYSSRSDYDQGSYGYNTYMGYGTDQASGRIQEDLKPQIMTALYKSNLAKNQKSMSLDVSNECPNRLRDKLVLGQNNSIDNVLETNGYEDFNSSNLAESKAKLSQMTDDE